MRKCVVHSFRVVAIVFLSGEAYSQDFTNILEQKPFTFSGSFNATQVTTYRNVSYSSSNPYSIFLNGNASLNFYGISFPFSFSYCNQQVNYSQPFKYNQFGAQPSYKWVKAYIGYNSMSFSPYSLNGHQFLGGGVELSPSEIGLRVSMMYGRLVKAVEWNPEKPATMPYYERYGYAVKVGYTGDAGNYEVSLFKAKDRVKSIKAIPDSLGVTPRENMVYTIKLGNTFYKKIKVAGEYAGSALTLDLRQEENESQVSDRQYLLIHNNATTSYSSAFKGSADYLGSTYTIGIAYERVEPNYSTLGTYYCNNDLENVAVTFSKQLLQGRLNVAGSTGTQRNNLDGSKISTSKQFLGNLNLSYAPSQRVSINTTYSNYSYFTYVRTQFDQINTTNPYKNLDTLNFTQISQSATLSSSTIVGSLERKDIKKLVMMSLSYQQSKNNQHGIGCLNSSYFYQGNVSYSYSKVPRSLTLTTSILGSYNYVPRMQRQVVVGPVIGISKSFINKKLVTNSSLAYNLSMKDGDYTGGVYSLRLGGGYSHQKVHRLNISIAMIYKENKLDVVKPTTFEFTGNLGYTYSFDSK